MTPSPYFPSYLFLSSQEIDKQTFISVLKSRSRFTFCDDESHRCYFIQTLLCTSFCVCTLNHFALHLFLRYKWQTTETAATRKIFHGDVYNKIIPNNNSNFFCLKPSSFLSDVDIMQTM